LKTIDTLVPDIEAQLLKSQPLSKAALERFGARVTKALDRKRGEEKPSLRLSRIGVPCDRKLWYSINQPDKAEPHRPSLILKWMFGDLIEQLILTLAEEAGHKVESEQAEVTVAGVPGHIDAVVDGTLVDCKSAASRSFEKFENHDLIGNDPFGYLDQLGSYQKGVEDFPEVTNKTTAAFIVVDKQHGHICLDKHKKGKRDYDAFITAKKTVTASAKPPNRAFSDTPDGKSGNKRLCTECAYCDFKHTCWPGVRTFIYSNGPRYLTRVDRLPEVIEVNN